MIHENETADEKSYYSDYDEETDEELEKELPDATGKKKWNFLNVLFELFTVHLHPQRTVLISGPSTFVDFPL